MANLTFANLQTFVKRTINNRDDMDTEVSNAIDQAYLNLAALRGVTFHELDGGPVSFNTGSGTRRYSFSTIIGGSAGRNVLAVMSPMFDTTNRRFITKHDPGYFDKLDQSTNSKPVWFCNWGSQIEFHPTPDGTYAIRMRYRLRPTKLSAGSTASVLQEEFDWAIVWSAAEIMNALIGSVEKASYYRDMAGRVVKSIAAAYEVEDQWSDFASAADVGRL